LILKQDNKEGTSNQQNISRLHIKLSLVQIWEFDKINEPLLVGFF
jgi:hypothetical protein